MKAQLIELIVKRLDESKDDLKEQFFREHPIKVAHHFVLDNLLPTEIAEEIYANFPKPRKMRLIASFGELRFKFSYVKYESSLLQDFHFAIQDPKVIAAIGEITEIKNQLPDKSPISGTITTFLKGHYVNPHLDSSHDVGKKLYQTVNLLYYVSPNWKLENGGNYELWDESVNNRVVVPNLFNRLVVMETNQKSWHAVSPVLCKQPRCCLLNYYYSEQPPRGQKYFHAPSSRFYNPLIRPRPEQRIRRAIASIKDTIFRRKRIKSEQ